MPSNRKPWPLPVIYGGMGAFGAVAAVLGVSVGQLAALGVIAACLALGPP